MASAIENILFGKQYAAIEFFSLNHRKQMAFLTVHKKKDELVITRNECFDTIEGLNEKKTKVPSVLIINTDQVLQKEVRGVDSNDKKLLHKAFPNLQDNDFYYEIWRRTETSLIAICRKVYVDDLFKSLDSHFRIAAVSLGVLTSSILSGFVMPESITTNTQRIFLDGEDFVATETVNAENYLINGLSIANTYILAFCGTLTFLLPSVTTGSITNVGSRLKEAYKQKAFFEKGITMAIAFLLSLLLINFLLFSIYFGKANKITQAVTASRAGIEKIAKIKVRIKDKQQKLESFTSNAASSSSLLLNGLVKDMPASIRLSEMIYHPLEKKVKEGEAVIVNDSLVTISGSTLNTIAFTGWVESIGKNRSVKNVMITSFGRDQVGNTVFSVNIFLKQ